MVEYSGVPEPSALQREIRQPRPFHTRRVEAAMSLLRTADVVRHRFAAILEPHGITGQQYNVLRILRGALPDPLPTMEIAERMLERTPGITRLLDRLEAKGLVERRRAADDRRCVHCTITPPGVELLAELDAPIARADDEVLAMLDDTRVEELVGLLSTIRAGLEASGGAPGGGGAAGG